MRSIGALKYIIIAALCVCALALFGMSATAFAEQAELDGNDQNRRVRITVVARDKTFVYTDEHIVPSDFTVSEEIDRRKINAPLEEKIELIDKCLAKGASYKTAISVCFPLLERVVDDAARYLFVPATDAEVKYTGGGFTVTQERAGRELDENKLYAGIYCSLKFSGGGEVKAYTVKIQPQVTREQLKENLVLRGKYTTDFSSSTSARAHNVSLALTKFAGASVASGETLSFNGVVGARTEQNGFKSAKIIVDGQYTDGVGGGVCQASTALYNAALLADLHCSANAHSICPSYCPAGLDAMISSASDLLITNTTAHPVYISVKVQNGRGTVCFYGEKSVYNVVPESVTVKTVKCDEIENVDKNKVYFDETAVSGDRLLVSPGKDGVVSETYLKYYKDGGFVKRIKIRRNEYKALSRIIAVAP